MNDVKLLLRDLDGRMVQAWRSAFRGLSNVEVTGGPIFEETADAIVSPANSFGFMDGGIDLVYVGHFGWQLQTRLQEHLRDHFEGELLVGQATIIETDDASIRWLVSAPSMRVPHTIADTVNVFLAFRAALRAVRDHNAQHPGSIRSVLCPGIGTGIGRMPHERAAMQMRAAWDEVRLGRTDGLPNAGRTLEAHWSLLR